MRSLIAVVVLVALVGCSGESLTSPTYIEPQPVAGVAPAPAAILAPAAIEPTPEIGPSYWSAWIDDFAGLNHSNIGGHLQRATACAYRDGVLVGSKAMEVRPHVTEHLWPLPSGAWTWPAGKLLVFGLVGADRLCTATPAGIGNITTRRELDWPNPNGCFRAAGC